MRKKGLLLIFLIACTCTFIAWKIIDKNTNHTAAYHLPADSAHFEKDILPDILALNNNDKYKPKQNFRKGHVSEAKLDNYLSKTEDGFCIQLPTYTNIPTPAVVDGHIYLSGGFGSKQYYSFDATTGQLKWGINLDDDGPSSPAIQDGIVVFNTESCTIFACDLVTGKQVWSWWLGDPLMSMPTIANGLVFTSYPAHYEGNYDPGKKGIFPTHVLVAFDLKTGEIRWQKWIDSDVMSAPVAKNDLLHITSFSGALYKIRQQTGEILEAKAIRATSAPVFDNEDELIVSRRSDDDKDTVVSETIVKVAGIKTKAYYRKQADYLDQKVQSSSELKKESAKMDAGNGFAAGAPTSANWGVANLNIGQSNVASLQSFQGSRALYSNGRTYNTMGDEIVCTDTSGTLKWKYALGGELKKQGGFMGTPPVYANGYLIIATLSGEVLLMDAKEGTVIRKFVVKDPIRYQPIAEKGWIYVTTVNSKLYAINTGNPAITGWNMWGGNPARTNMGK